MDMILKSGEHLLRLINDVLALSKSAVGSVHLEPAPFDLGRLVDDVVAMLQARADAKGLRLSAVVEAALPQAVLGDAGRLQQILVDLLGNAVKFTERGEVTLRASWWDGRASFDVQDTGPGIDPAERESVFAPFQQTESGLRSGEGTGLGLALSRDLARLMQGNITVESAPGEGACFRVEVALPQAEAGARVSDATLGRVLALAPGQPSLRVLVVDDLAPNRTLLSGLLGAVGFEVAEADSGEQALELWHSFEPHLVWMDTRMPGLGGLETTRRMRSMERGGRPRVTILAISASALEHERNEILAAGCDGFVAKPFREATIFDEMARHLGVRWVRGAGFDDHVAKPIEPDVLVGTVERWLARSGRAEGRVRGDHAPGRC